MAIYSHSKISTFEQCPLKFKFRYLDKIIPEVEESIEGFLGNTVHTTLEWLYKNVMNKNIPKLDELIEFYINKWTANFSNEIRIVKEDLDSEYYFNQGIKFIINYYKSHYPFSDNTIALEHRILINLDPEGKYKLQGYIDRLVHNRENNVFEIHDYKTGNFLKSQEELDKDRQLALYCLGIKETFQNAKDVFLIWHFLAFDEKIVSKRTDEELENLKKDTINSIQKIESETEFKPCPSKLCKWCEFRNICPLFKNGYLDLSGN
ncbi:MAG: PD-(D/E)XK nuclease family protein [Candidatus Pacearchaeota archaeon]